MRWRSSSRSFVFENVLYVATENPGEGRVLGFSPADGLTDGQAPDFVLGPGLDDPLSVAHTGGRLFIANSDDDANGIVGYDNPAGLVTGSLADVTLRTVAQDPEELEGLLGSLWTTSDDSTCVHGWLDAATITTDQPPDIVLFDPAMDRLKSLVVRERP